GIDFVQIQTTLLSQKDSSIGGKTGVDFDGYKNMVGAFHQPKLVYINVSTLNSLSKRQYNSGMGEVIKHGYIKDKSYYNWLLDNKAKIIEKDLETLEEMIYVSCYTKKLVVENDPKEQGERALLNFGHTLGHAIEKLMNFSLYHGECVVLGMIAALNISKAKGYITDEEIKQALLLFKDFEFPVTVKGITVNEVLEVSKSDKKMDKGRIKFIILQEVGNAVIDTNISDTELVASLKDIITA
ncbi:MAG: 3-dehydroquinate synthase, partial [Lachnospiraceae bacterium]|nr:3-dehydroquinate synthase [Lachnospiraceae bacterium]